MAVTDTLPAGDLRDPFRRLGQLFDEGRFEPLNPSAADAAAGAAGHVEVQVVRGEIDGVKVIAFCTDATRMGGALGQAGSDRIVEATDTAVAENCPVVGVWHSGGAKLADGVESMNGVGEMFAAMTRASGKVPQISVIVGPAAGAAAYGPALTDVVIMAPAARMFITGPDVVRSVTGQQIDMDGLGGPEAHGRRSGVSHVSAHDEADAYLRTRDLVALLGRPGHFTPEPGMPGEDLGALLPDSPRRAYDVHPIINAVLDPAEHTREAGSGFFELQAKWAPNVVTGLGRLGGGTVGVVATNPIRKGGCLDSISAEKASRFVRMCDALGIPLLVLVDVPGYLPGVGEEWNGVVRRGAKLLHAFAEASVPRVTLVTRKAYGGAYIAMNSRSLGATAYFAWPNAEIAVMGAQAAVEVLHRKKLAAVAPEGREALLAELVAQQEREAGGVNRALALGVLDEVVEPHDTRRKLIETFGAHPATRGQHKNIPL
ncbi:propionyl-CoA carboxylase subunit beta [Kineosporia sp. NBRC 101677]|nr:carboxyl transferase domain-containing protein [Kineosporia sp. NBRC 101677]GLY16550.1 propionyl-CoA carboxylase subunit beta [Kineosporia sp. NBRC 101677]